MAVTVLCWTCGQGLAKVMGNQRRHSTLKQAKSSDVVQCMRLTLIGNMGEGTLLLIQYMRLTLMGNMGEGTLLVIQADALGYGEKFS